MLSSESFGGFFERHCLPRRRLAKTGLEYGDRLSELFIAAYAHHVAEDGHRHDDVLTLLACHRNGSAVAPRDGGFDLGWEHCWGRFDEMILSHSLWFSTLC